MAVRRIVSNIRTDNPTALAAFYSEVFDLDIVMESEQIWEDGVDTDVLESLQT